MIINGKIINFPYIILILISLFNSKEIAQNNLVNQITGRYIPSNSNYGKSNNIFDISSLNLTENDYDIYINGVKEEKSSNIYPFVKGIIYDIKIIFHKLLVKTENMFKDCVSLIRLDLSQFDTSQVTNMNKMFYGCSSLISINLNNFNTEKVIFMEDMFYSCESLPKLNLSSFNTLNVYSMESMFSGCLSLRNLDLSSFNTKNVKNMGWLFSHCESVTSINLSNINTRKVKTM